MGNILWIQDGQYEYGIISDQESLKIKGTLQNKGTQIKGPPTVPKISENKKSLSKELR